MSKQVQVIVLTTLCGTILLGVGFWRYRTAGQFPPAHAVIVRDRSDSVPTGCECTRELVRLAVAAPHMRGGSTVTLTVTGNGRIAEEPILLASVAVPVNRQVLEGRAATRKQAQPLDDIQARCDKIGQTKVSPVFLAIRRAVEHLRSLGCGPVSNCFVYVQSDLEEIGDRQVTAALAGSPGQRQALPVPINNEGITVIISGVAETTGRAIAPGARAGSLRRARNPDRADHIYAVWRRLFTAPERVPFEPHCPKR